MLQGGGACLGGVLVTGVVMDERTYNRSQERDSRRRGARVIANWDGLAEDVVRFYEGIVKPAATEADGSVQAVSELLRDGQDLVSLKALAMAYASYCVRRGLQPASRASAAVFYALQSRECRHDLALVRGRNGLGL